MLGISSLITHSIPCCSFNKSKILFPFSHANSACLLMPCSIVYLICSVNDTGINWFSIVLSRLHFGFVSRWWLDDRKSGKDWFYRIEQLIKEDYDRVPCAKMAMQRNNLKNKEQQLYTPMLNKLMYCFCGVVITMLALPVCLKFVRPFAFSVSILSLISAAKKLFQDNQESGFDEAPQ